MEKLKQNDLIEINQDTINISSKQIIALIAFAIQEGADIFKISKTLRWQEFEDLALFILELYDFSVKKHFRFKVSDKKSEIDIVGIRRDLILFLECKHWKKTQRSAIINAAKNNLLKISNIVNNPEILFNHFKIKTENYKLIPVILTLTESIKIYDKIPIVPIYYFQNFLLEFDKYFDELLILKSKKMDI